MKRNNGFGEYCDPSSFGEESSERDGKGKSGGRVEEVKKEPQSIIKEFMNRLKGGENKGNNGDGNNILTKREEKNPSDTRLKASAAKQREPAEKKRRKLLVGDRPFSGSYR